MRIIAGEFRGRRIQVPPGKGTRPLLDRIREAVFSTLNPWLQDASVIDLFAGSGSLGLEALSRGARHVQFVESDARTVALLKENVEDLGAGERSEIIRGDALALERFGPGAADVAFFDPPYPMLDEGDSRREVLRVVDSLVRDILAFEGVVVFHAPRRKLSQNDFASDVKAVERTYGSNSMWYLQRESEA